eukprot:3539471-Rhodomonas_salina.1
MHPPARPAALRTFKAARGERKENLLSDEDVGKRDDAVVVVHLGKVLGEALAHLRVHADEGRLEHRLVVEDDDEALHQARRRDPDAQQLRHTRKERTESERVRAGHHTSHTAARSSRGARRTSAYSLSNFSSVSLLSSPLIFLYTTSSSSVGLPGFHRDSDTSSAFTSMIFPVRSRSGTSFFPRPLLGVRGVPLSCRLSPRGVDESPVRDGMSLLGSNSGLSPSNHARATHVSKTASRGAAR